MPPTASAMQQWLVALKYQYDMCLEQLEDATVVENYEYFSTDEEDENTDAMKVNEDKSRAFSATADTRKRSSTAHEIRRRSSTVNLATYFVQGSKAIPSQSHEDENAPIVASDMDSIPDNAKVVQDGVNSEIAIERDVTSDKLGSNVASTKSRRLQRQSNSTPLHKTIGANRRKLKADSARKISRHISDEQAGRRESFDENILTVNSNIMEDPKISNSHNETLRQNVRKRIHQFLKKSFRSMH